MKDLVKLYEEGLKEYVRRRGEGGPGRAYEIGGVALREGRTANEMAGAFQKAFEEMQESLPPFAERARLLQDSAIFFVESLKPLEISSKSLREVIGDLQRRVDTLEEANRKLRAEISDRMESDELLRRQANLLEYTQDAIVACDLDQRVVYTNRSAAACYGFSAREAVGLPLRQVLRQPDDAPVFERAVQGVRENGEWHGELNLISPGGSFVALDSRWTLIPASNTISSAILVVTTSILERAKKVSPGNVRRFDDAGILTSGILYTLNEIISPLFSGLEKLDEKINGDEKQKLMRETKRGIREASNLLSQMLAQTTELSGSGGLIHPGLILRSLEVMVKQIFPKSISVHVSVEGDLWRIRGDASLVHQALLNLCVLGKGLLPGGGDLNLRANNVVASRNDALVIGADHAGEYVVLTISTFLRAEVKGIPKFTGVDQEQEISRLFSEVEENLRGQNGALKMRKAGRRGVEFKVSFPAEGNSAHAERDNMSTATGRGELVLVVDDEEPIREIAKVTLEANGYRVMTASDGAEAVSLFAKRSGKIKAVLIDIMMPYMGGDKAIRAMFQIDPAARIIASSGYATSSTFSQIVDPERISFLRKPYTSEMLLTTLRSVLRSTATDTPSEKKQKTERISS